MAGQTCYARCILRLRMCAGAEAARVRVLAVLLRAHPSSTPLLRCWRRVPRSPTPSTCPLRMRAYSHPRSSPRSAGAAAAAAAQRRMGSQVSQPGLLACLLDCKCPCTWTRGHQRTPRSSCNVCMHAGVVFVLGAAPGGPGSANMVGGQGRATPVLQATASMPSPSQLLTSTLHRAVRLKRLQDACVPS